MEGVEMARVSETASVEEWKAARKAATKDDKKNDSGRGCEDVI